MQDRPRLGIVSRLYPLPYRPESGTFNREQFKRLARRYDVSLLVPVPFHEWVRHRKHLGPERRDGIELRYAGWAFPPKVARATYAACFGFSLLPSLRWLVKRSSDCIVVSWAYPDAVGVIAAMRLLGEYRPILIKAHGGDLNVHASAAHQAAQTRWAARQSAAVICGSDALAQQAKKLGIPAEKTRVIRNGLDHALFSPLDKVAARERVGLGKEREIVLFVGNVIEAKGIHDLREAFTKVAARRPSVDLVVVGDGPEKARLRRAFARASLEQRVQIVGRVPHAELCAWYNAADVVCLPSHREGLPNVLREATACGTPFVATRVGGVPEITMEENGILVKPHDPHSLGQALENALDRRWDPDLIARTSPAASWEDNASAMAREIERASAQERR